MKKVSCSVSLRPSIFQLVQPSFLSFIASLIIFSSIGATESKFFVHPLAFPVAIWLGYLLRCLYRLFEFRSIEIDERAVQLRNRFNSDVQEYEWRMIERAIVKPSKLSLIFRNGKVELSIFMLTNQPRFLRDLVLCLYPHLPLLDAKHSEFRNVPVQRLRLIALSFGVCGLCVGLLSVAKYFIGWSQLVDFTPSVIWVFPVLHLLVVAISQVNLAIKKAWSFTFNGSCLSKSGFRGQDGCKLPPRSAYSLHLEPYVVNPNYAWLRWFVTPEKGDAPRLVVINESHDFWVFCNLFRLVAEAGDYSWEYDHDTYKLSLVPSSPC